MGEGDNGETRCTVTGAVSRFDTFNPQGRRASVRGPYHDRGTGVSRGRGAVAFSASGRFALGICGDDALRIWDLADGTCTRTLAGHAAVPTAVWLGPDARRAVSAGSDGEIRVWDVDRRCVRRVPAPGRLLAMV
ncbi:WD40 repeat domain-containing protein [Streptomyces sp. NPDC058525]|uniref:WD40 repeat domain-containing protein n=1 Tax=Streptomyces sp. NPDC058525 TaxID=3346538 RepID=UPI00364F4BA4